MIKKQYFIFFSICVAFFAFFPWHECSAAYVSINSGKESTKVRKIDLYLVGPEGTKQMIISNKPDFAGAVWENYQQYKLWFFDYGAGTRTVYVKFKGTSGIESSTYTDTILLNPPSVMSVGFKINNNASQTNSRSVSLTISWSDGVEQMRISNSKDFGLYDWINIDDDIMWVLSAGTGNKTVYMEFIDSNGAKKVVSQSIKYTQPANYVSEGTLLKGSSSAVYYLGFDGKIHPFFDSVTYGSWYKDFSNILRVSNSKLKQYDVGTPVCIRPGAWLVKFKNSDKIYAVEPGCALRQMRSVTEAIILYGANWSKRVVKLDPLLENYYTKVNMGVSVDLVDADKDGVDLDTEEQYNSSDNSSDSDKDGLGDYEEIYFWFSDPMMADTDEDGFKDGKEVQIGYSPLGPGKISSVPNGTYSYPIGSMIRGKASSDLYYRHFNGQYYRVNGDVFNYNRFQHRFVIKQSYNIPFSVDGGNLPNSVENIVRPQKKTSGGNLVNL